MWCKMYVNVSVQARLVVFVTVLSYSMEVLYSRDHGNLGFLPKYHPNKPHIQFGSIGLA